MDADFISYLPNLIPAFSAYLVAIISPGPATLAIMGAAIGHGRQCGLALASGVIAGSMCWGVLAAFGLSAVLAAFPLALKGIGILGGGYLLWLAWKSLRSAFRTQDPRRVDPSAMERSWRRFFLRGFAIHMTNPKALFAWVAMIALGLRADAPAHTAFVIVVGCAVLAITVFGLYAIAFSTPTMVRIYGRSRRWFEIVMALLFGFAGIGLLISNS